MFAEVAAVKSLPEDIDVLLGEASQEGYGLVARLVDEWHDGSNRFDRPGEALFTVRIDGRLVAVGGLNIDPYLDDPAVGRIRHVYVAKVARGQGLGSRLVRALVDFARQSFDRVRLRVVAPDAGVFYETLGFQAIDEEHATHGRMLP